MELTTSSTTNLSEGETLIEIDPNTTKEKCSVSICLKYCHLKSTLTEGV